MGLSQHSVRPLALFLAQRGPSFWQMPLVDEYTDPKPSSSFQVHTRARDFVLILHEIICMHL